MHLERVGIIRENFAAAFIPFFSPRTSRPDVREPSVPPWDRGGKSILSSPNHE